MQKYIYAICDIDHATNEFNFVYATSEEDAKERIVNELLEEYEDMDVDTWEDVLDYLNTYENIIISEVFMVDELCS